MQNIKPISNLKNINKQEAQHCLMSELAEGRNSGEKEGWISSEDVRHHFNTHTNTK